MNTTRELRPFPAYVSDACKIDDRKIFRAKEEIPPMTVLAIDRLVFCEDLMDFVSKNMPKHSRVNETNILRQPVNIDVKYRNWTCNENIENLLTSHAFDGKSIRITSDSLKQIMNKKFIYTFGDKIRIEYILPIISLIKLGKDYSELNAAFFIANNLAYLFSIKTIHPGDEIKINKSEYKSNKKTKSDWKTLLERIKLLVAHPDQVDQMDVPHLLKTILDDEDFMRSRSLIKHQIWIQHVALFRKIDKHDKRFSDLLRPLFFRSQQQLSLPILLGYFQFMQIYVEDQTINKYSVSLIERRFPQLKYLSTSIPHCTLSYPYKKFSYSYLSWIGIWPHRHVAQQLWSQSQNQRQQQQVQQNINSADPAMSIEQTQKESPTRQSSSLISFSKTERPTQQIRQVLKKEFRNDSDDKLLQMIRDANITSEQLKDYIRLFKTYLQSPNVETRQQLSKHRPLFQYLLRMKPNHLIINPNPQLSTTNSHQLWGGSGTTGVKMLSPLFTNTTLDESLTALFPFYQGSSDDNKRRIKKIIIDWLLTTERDDIRSTDKLIELIPTLQELMRPILSGGQPVVPQQRPPVLSVRPLVFSRRDREHLPSPYYIRQEEKIQGEPVQMLPSSRSRSHLKIGTMNIQNPELGSSSKKQQMLQMIFKKEIVDVDILCFQEFPANQDAARRLFQKLPHDWTVILQGDAMTGNHAKKNRMVIAFSSERFQLVEWPGLVVLQAHVRQGEGGEAKPLLVLGEEKDDTHHFHIHPPQQSSQSPAIIALSNAMGVVLRDKQTYESWVLVNVHFVRRDLKKGLIQIERIRRSCDTFLSGREDYQVVVVGDFNTTKDVIQGQFSKSSSTPFMSFDTEFHQGHHEQQFAREHNGKKVKNIDGIILFPSRSTTSRLESIHTYQQQQFTSSDHPYKIFSVVRQNGDGSR